jgi:hypothetical protein
MTYILPMQYLPGQVGVGVSRNTLNDPQFLTAKLHVNSQHSLNPLWHTVNVTVLFKTVGSVPEMHITSQ